MKCPSCRCLSSDLTFQRLLPAATSEGTLCLTKQIVQETIQMHLPKACKCCAMQRQRCSRGLPCRAEKTSVLRACPFRQAFRISPHYSSMHACLW